MNSAFNPNIIQTVSNYSTNNQGVVLPSANVYNSSTYNIELYNQTPPNNGGFDFIIVGGGHAGCVIANRLSKKGYSICILEAGQDDSRIPTNKLQLPLSSYANVPQPGDFNWGSYIRSISCVSTQESRGFVNERFFMKASSDPKSRSISYPRAFTWGGCTSHNQTVSIRNAPFNWDSWNLSEWKYDQIKPFYKLTENRSQINTSTFKYYNSDIKEPLLGSNNIDYGTNGNVTLSWHMSSLVSPLYMAVNNIAILPEFNIPINMDLDNPTYASGGGTSINNVSQTDVYSSLFKPGEQTLVDFTTFNQNIYGDNGYIYPPELNSIGLSGLASTQRATSATSYLYEVEKSVTIYSNVLVTKILFNNNTAIGVEFEKGWNIYQAGRNLSIERGGYGGTPGDAKSNRNLTKTSLYAKREVIVCAGVINTPQLLLLSGIGPKDQLDNLGITCIKSLPVGSNLIDNPELFIYWETSPNFNLTTERVAISVKSDPSLQNVDFDLGLNNTGGLQSTEGEDATIQHGFVGTKNLGALDNAFVRNNPSNILIDPLLAGNPYVYSQTTFNPIYSNPNHRICMSIEQIQDISSLGYLQLTSTDPTIQPLLVNGLINNKNDQNKWTSVMNNVVLPYILNFSATQQASSFSYTCTGNDKNISVPNGGSGHNIPPVVLINGFPVVSMVANINKNLPKNVISITNNSGGMGYLQNTVVVTCYGGGAIKPSKINATVSNGSITLLTIIDPGQGYKSPPIIVCSGQSMTNNTVSIPCSAIATIDSDGKVNSVSINGNYQTGTVLNISFGYYFQRLLDPAPYDILKDNQTSFTSMDQVDQTKLLNYLTNRIGGHHAGGTCKMGIENDKSVVTDQKGLVYGVNNLRICDMSIVPVGVRWPNTTLYVVAEKIATDIINKYAF